jgi:hypothetical protein
MAAIDATVEWVRAHHPQPGDYSGLDYFGVVVPEFHTLGKRVQILASGLGLASAREPAYVGEVPDVSKIVHLPGGEPFAIMDNPTWPGHAQKTGRGRWRYIFFKLDASSNWYERMAVLRLKAEQIVAKADGSGGIEVEAGKGPPRRSLRDANPRTAGFLGAVDLAKTYKVPKSKMGTLHKRLERFRRKHNDDSRYVISVESPGPREARYLHAVEYVLPLIEDLKRPR